MTDSPPPAAIQSLPVGQTITASYRFVQERPALLVRAAAVPYFLAVVVASGLWFVRDVESIAIELLELGISLIPYTIFAVAWHRATLLGSEAGYPAIRTPVERRHVVFFAFALVADLIYFLPLTAVAPLSEEAGALGRMILWFLAYGLLSYVVLRLSFVFPAASVDERYRFQHSWQHTRGQGLRLFMVVVGVSLPVTLIVVALTAIILFSAHIVDPAFGSRDITELDTFLFVIYSLLLPLFNFVPVALIVSAVSIAFRTCTGWAPPAAASTR